MNEEKREEKFVRKTIVEVLRVRKPKIVSIKHIDPKSVACFEQSKLRRLIDVCRGEGVEVKPAMERAADLYLVVANGHHLYCETRYSPIKSSEWIYERRVPWSVTCDVVSAIHDLYDKRAFDPDSGLRYDTPTHDEYGHRSENPKDTRISLDNVVVVYTNMSSLPYERAFKMFEQMPHEEWIREKAKLLSREYETSQQESMLRVTRYRGFVSGELEKTAEILKGFVTSEPVEMKPAEQEFWGPLRM